VTVAKGYIPGFINGVSQEPGPLRGRTQGSLQINCVSSVDEGLSKRPPTEHVAVLESGTDRTGGTSKAEFFRQQGTDYVALMATGGTLDVFGIDGSAKTITQTAGATYRTDSNPRKNLRVLETPEKLYVLNRTVAPAQDATGAPGTLQGTKQLFGDLGTSGSAGDVWEIAGDPTTNFDNYYAKWDTSVWREGLKPGEAYQFDASTLPHTLCPCGGANDFEWDSEDWDARAVGDLASIPFPAWSGVNIQDIFYFQGRLGVVAEDTLGTSRVNEPTNFWPRTRVTVSDDDPLDLKLEASNMHTALAFDRDVVLFTDNGQYSLMPAEGGPLTPDTVSAVLVSNFSSSPDARPASSGTSMFFSFEDDNWANVRELQGRHEGIQRFGSEDTTSHVRKYIPKGVFQMVASSVTNTLVVLTSGDANAIYVFQHDDERDRRRQAAWSKWEFEDGAEVIGAAWVGADLYLVVARTAQVTLERIQFRGDSTEDAMGYRVLLDRRVELTGSYDSGADETTWTLPCADYSDVVAVTSEDFDSLGVQLNVTLSGDTVTVDGDYSAHSVYLGQPYEARYRISPQYVRNREGQVKTSGYLLLSTLDLSYTAGAFHVEVTPFDGGTTSTYRYYSWRIGSSKIGQHNIESGSLRVPVHARALDVVIELVNDTHLPSTWISAEWYGEWFSYAED